MRLGIVRGWVLGLAVCWFAPASDALARSAPGDDIAFLAETIKREHPRPFQFISKAAFDALAARLEDALGKQPTQREILWAHSELIASIGCGHSGLPYFNQEDALIAVSERFPVEVRWHDDRLLVMDPLVNSDVLRQGDEISHINGIAVAELMADIYRHISADMNNPYRKRHRFNVYATSYLTYALDFPAHYRVTVAGQQIALGALTTFSPQPIISPKASCQETLCFEVGTERGIGIMTVRSFDFYGERGNVFAAFVDDVFARLEREQLKALLIDVRGNGGGSGLAAAYILRHLAERAFPYFSRHTDRRARAELLEMQTPIEHGFKGPVYLLMDGGTGSSAPHFLAIAKAQGLATLIGEPAGGGTSTTDGAKRFSAPASGIEYKIARMRFDVAAPGVDAAQVVQPDIELPYSEAQVLTREDVMRASTLRLIEAQVQ